jgi:exonuclease SbcC
MRPVRLELEGFTAFRDLTVVDFAGADLFALCGPTGAGKTSIIDAITFALYGSVPRLNDLRAVAPVISQGKVEAKVRLDFTVGADAYTAVRVVRATKSGGATTKEARLERAGDGDLLAGDADDVTKSVGELLGLDYRQFTTCVSLPQGDFARFLHDKPRDRQDLLVKLLDLGLYERIAQAARQRSALAHDRVVLASGRLEQLAGATPDAVDAAAARVAELGALRDQLDLAEPELAALRTAVDTSSVAATVAADTVALLDRVVVPDGVDAMAAAVATARDAREQAVVADDAGAAALVEAESALGSLPTRAAIEARRADHAAGIDLAHQVERGRDALASVAAADVEAASALAGAEQAVVDATQADHAARIAHAAHALAAELVVGEPCPVCNQTVTEVSASRQPDLDVTKRAKAAADKACAAARKAATTATTERARVEEKLAGVRDQLAAVEARLADAPDLATLDDQLERVRLADEAVADAKQRAAAARKLRSAADAAVTAAAAAEADGRRAFDAARDGVASLSPPPPRRDDLAADWTDLATWVDAQRPALVEAASRHREEAEIAQRALTLRAAELVDACRAARVDAGANPRDAVVEALAHAEGDRARLEAARADVEQIRIEHAAATADEQVSRSLADHLAANRFEQWLLDEALQQLVAAATIILRELSGDAYSLALDPKSRAFTVTDHVNADNVRSARTLSGGETFLASVALALALADQVAGLAGSSARLETILLDEGFGSLDGETLDVVAAALEELGARGRTVGIVTHVRDLAERLPVRFEVTKVGGAATVERVEA